ncbi:glycosyltransferase [Acinetobacter calcoaceticus]|uniref:glycosyltransferase n=1 Tax=Acinetobacter calcoaceticus TaxID=471 RepID=UPI0019019C3F|nr:glycosyltransferase [Acinetobacter calcoaceticus]MBJ9722869.1 glycosyltransferase [Acinetobacter calcoaceticus]
MEKPLVSIAIATKNRQKYCIEAIKSILAYNNSQIEIAIADNSATSEIQEFVEDLNSPFVKYFYDGKDNVSSIDNFNRALELTSGDYVMLIGDDDSILPKVVEVAQWAKDNNIDSVCSHENLIYYWPNVLEEYPNGVMITPPSTGKITKINFRKHLNALLENGLQLYLLYPLPKTYHGLVKRSLMEEIKNRVGHYYGGLSPDLYSSIAISCVANNHFIIDEPLSIAGVCTQSTTADNFKGLHSGSLEGIPHLKNRPNYVFSDRIPLYYSVNTIWAESGLKALEELNEEELLQKFNMHRLMAQAWIHNRKYISSIMKEKHKELLFKHHVGVFNKFFSFTLATIYILINKCIRTLKGLIGKEKSVKVEGVLNITEVIEQYRKDCKR